MIKKLLASKQFINKRLSFAVLTVFSLLAASAISIIVASGSNPVSAGVTTPASSSAIFARGGVSSLPALLTARDRQLYRDIFVAQSKGDWATANNLCAKLTSKKLMGHVLAQRYLHSQYNSQPEQLQAWMQEYADHPQAERIHALALKKAPSLRSKMLQPETGRKLQGYGDDSGLAAWKRNSRHASRWDQGIDAWRNKQYTKAAIIFSDLAQQNRLHRWKKSASAFWAHRAYSELGKHNKAVNYLRKAAAQPRTFYGVLARQKLGLSLGLDKAPAALSDSDVLELMGDKPLRRIIALSRIGAGELAETEIRQMFFSASKTEQKRLLTIANELNLASVQIAMARYMANRTEQLDFARYPVPAWKPHTGFSVDPALIYAMARQESGFRSKAVSHAGALGVMQLMPKTVSIMQKRAKRDIQDMPVSVSNAAEPATNMTLGQHYIEHLLDIPMVENNMFYLLTAYNAGPGRLQTWKRTIGHKQDPLLFLESIPFGETRSYVMQVMTNYWIYSELMGQPTNSHQALLKNQWPNYEPPAKAIVVADASAHSS